MYFHVLRYGFRRHSTYRAAALAGAFTNTVFGFLRAYVLIALWQARPGLAGYDVIDAITFCFITQAMIGPTQIFGGTSDLAQRVRSGDIAVDLYRPVILQAWYLADDLGRALYQLIVRSIIPVVIGAVFFPLAFPEAPAEFGVSLVLAVVVSFSLRYLVALATFWILDDRGVQQAMLVMTMFFSGMMVPLGILPGWLGSLAEFLPWSALIQVPADVYLGQRAALSGLGFQVIWAVVLLAFGGLLTIAARRRVVVQGG